MADEEGTEKDNSQEGPSVRVIAPIEGLDSRARMAPMRVSTSVTRMCDYHTSIPAIHICAKCSKPLCINCARPYGNLFLCPHCMQPPAPQPRPRPTTETTTPKKKLKKPPIEAILGFFGALLILAGFFMPWVTSSYESPRGEEFQRTFTSGFDIAADYPEVELILIMAGLIGFIEFILIMLETSPTVVKRTPIGVRLLPMFLGFVAYITLAEVILRAESLLRNIHMGWFVCMIGGSIILLSGVMEIWKHYKETRK